MNLSWQLNLRFKNQTPIRRKRPKANKPSLSSTRSREISMSSKNCSTTWRARILRILIFVNLTTIASFRTLRAKTFNFWRSSWTPSLIIRDRKPLLVAPNNYKTETRRWNTSWIRECKSSSKSRTQTLSKKYLWWAFSNNSQLQKYIQLWT